MEDYIRPGSVLFPSRGGQGKKFGAVLMTYMLYSTHVMGASLEDRGGDFQEAMSQATRTDILNVPRRTRTLRIQDMRAICSRRVNQGLHEGQSWALWRL